MARSTTVTVLTDDLIVTPDIHDTIRDWFKTMRPWLNMSEVARVAQIDASFLRNVLLDKLTPKGSPLRFNDETVRKLSVIAATIAIPPQIKIVK